MRSQHNCGHGTIHTMTEREDSSPFAEVPAARRRDRAEEKDEVSLSHYAGSLHVHSGTPETFEHAPDEIVEGRHGSNCGKIPAEVLAAYYGETIGYQYLGLTDHSRDASPDKAVEGVTAWFSELYQRDAGWLQRRFGVDSSAKLTTEQRAIIGDIAEKQAQRLALYGDERLRGNLASVETVNAKEDAPIRVFKGVEVNILPDGSLDTKLVDEGAFELVNVSLHPNVRPSEFASVIRDPDAYVECITRGMKHSRANIVSHIGFGCERDFAEKLDWDRIAQTAIEHDVAIEINLKELMDFINGPLMDEKQYPGDSTGWQKALQERLPSLIPLVSSPAIRARLKTYVGKGLRFAVNTDEHANRFIEITGTPELPKVKTKDRGYRFWRALKIVEQYCNDCFADLGVTRDNLVNSYSLDRLQAFLQKRETGT